MMLTLAKRQRFEVALPQVEWPKPWRSSKQKHLQIVVLGAIDNGKLNETKDPPQAPQHQEAPSAQERLTINLLIASAGELNLRP
jgi:hypothetical protein